MCACASGTFSNQTHATECGNCLSGTFSLSNGATKCEGCPIGRASNLTRLSDQCPVCSPGFYADQPGMTGCKPCEVGKASGIYEARNCTQCKLPLYQLNQGASTCSQCDFGKYLVLIQSVIQRPPCADCPANAICGGNTEADSAAPPSNALTIVQPAALAIRAAEGYWLKFDPQTGRYTTLQCQHARCSSDGKCSEGRVQE